eukprot:scaffold407197_cov19-Prasinocladus_malaysianus.AAC.1
MHRYTVESAKAVRAQSYTNSILYGVMVSHPPTVSKSIQRLACITYSVDEQQLASGDEASLLASNVRISAFIFDPFKF